MSFLLAVSPDEPSETPNASALTAEHRAVVLTVLRHRGEAGCAGWFTTAERKAAGSQGRSTPRSSLGANPAQGRHCRVPGLTKAERSGMRIMAAPRETSARSSAGMGPPPAPKPFGPGRIGQGVSEVGGPSVWDEIFT